MDQLKEMGEFVRSASSTIEAPVVRRLKEVVCHHSGARPESNAGSEGFLPGQPGRAASSRGPQRGGQPAAGIAQRNGCLPGQRPVRRGRVRRHAVVPSRAGRRVGVAGGTGPGGIGSDGTEQAVAPDGASARTPAATDGISAGPADGAASERPPVAPSPASRPGPGEPSHLERAAGPRTGAHSCHARGLPRSGDRPGPSSGPAACRARCTGPPERARRAASRQPRPGSPGPGSQGTGAAPRSPAPGGAPRPGAPRPGAPRPGAPRPGPRPGNNPFSSTATGMGSAPPARPQSPAPGAPGAGAAGPGAPGGPRPARPRARRPR